MPWSPMRAADQDRVARPRPIAGNVDARRDNADAGGGDEHAVALALLDHLGVAGDDGHAGGGWRAAMLATMRSRSPAGSLPPG